MARKKDPAKRISIKLSIFNQLDKSVVEILQEYLGKKSKQEPISRQEIKITRQDIPDKRFPVQKIQKQITSDPIICKKECDMCKRFDDCKRVCTSLCHL